MPRFFNTAGPNSLIERLREPRVRAIIEPMLAGETLGEVSEDDRRFAVDLGLVRRSEAGGLEVANPIYREVIVRHIAPSVAHCRRASATASFDHGCAKESHDET